MSSVDDLAAEVLAAITSTGEPAARLLKRTFRRHRELDNADRRRVAELVHGVRCHRLRLAYLLDQLGRGKDELFRTYDEDRAGQLEPTWPADPLERLIVERSLPRFIAGAFLEQFVAAADDVAATLNTPGPLAIRANTLMNDRGALLVRLTEDGMSARPGTLAPHALRLQRPVDIRGSASWKAGRFEVQDEGSQMIAAAVEARPGEVVVDLCAGAGGKTLALAADMHDRGRLWAGDIDPDRLHDLTVRLDRVRTTCIRPADLRIEKIPPGADRVLVDAPCSATGTWRRGPDRKWHVTPADIVRLRTTQHELLNQALRLVRPGGRIVYATCSLLRAENDDVVDAFVQKHPRFAANKRWILPHWHDTDGFFIAVLTG